MLAFTGVRDWKIKDYKLVSLHPPQDTLVLVGSYRGVSGQQVQFYEVNIYDHEDHFQLTYTQDRAQGIDKTEVKQLLSKMELHQ